MYSRMELAPSTHLCADVKWTDIWAPSANSADHRFVNADIVACMNHTLHWKFSLMGFEAKYFKQLYVFLCLGKKFEHASSPRGERFLFSSCQNTRVIWVFLSSFPDACLELMGLNRSNLLCWHLPPSNCTKSQPSQIHYHLFPWRSCCSEDRTNGLGNFRSEPKVKPDW